MQIADAMVIPVRIHVEESHIGWLGQNKGIPALAALLLLVFYLTPSEAECERVFSVVKQTVDEHRMKMTPEHANACVTVRTLSCIDFDAVVPRLVPAQGAAPPAAAQLAVAGDAAPAAAAAPGAPAGPRLITATAVRFVLRLAVKAYRELHGVIKSATTCSCGKKFDDPFHRGARDMFECQVGTCAGKWVLRCYANLLRCSIESLEPLPRVSVCFLCNNASQDSVQ